MRPVIGVWGVALVALTVTLGPRVGAMVTASGQTEAGKAERVTEPVQTGPVQTAAGQTGAGQPSAPASTPVEKPAPPTRGAADTASSTPESRLTLYMPDGQLASHVVRIYVNHDLPSTAEPRLHLFGSNALTEPGPTDGNAWKPRLVAAGQEWTQVSENGDGPVVTGKGTLLLFDLKPLPFNGKAMRRVMPVLEWSEAGADRVAVGQREVNVGNIVLAAAWTALVIAIALGAIIVLARRSGGNPMLLLTAVDGHLSLAQAQIACWTLAAGGVVLLYGFIRLTIPEIPESLLVLMGASLTTGGLAFFRDAQKHDAALAGGAPAQIRPWHWGDLLMAFEPDAPPQLSLAKAQMLFWTGLLIVLFVSKSILDGAIWNVPWPLVALLGFSQAGYLAPKLASRP